MIKIKNVGESLENAVINLMSKCDDLFNGLLHSVDFDEFDEETGKLMGSYAEIWWDSKKLALLQAQTMDHIITDLEELKETNETLRKQNNELKEMLKKLYDSCTDDSKKNKKA